MWYKKVQALAYRENSIQELQQLPRARKSRKLGEFSSLLYPLPRLSYTYIFQKKFTLALAIPSFPDY